MNAFTAAQRQRLARYLRARDETRARIALVRRMSWLAWLRDAVAKVFTMKLGIGNRESPTRPSDAPLWARSDRASEAAASGRESFTMKLGIGRSGQAS